jgi:hypothetical protein
LFTPLTIFLIYFSVLLLLFGIAFGTGHFILKYFSTSKLNSFWTGFFFKSLTGITFIIVLASLIYTSGKTISFVFLLVVLFIFLERFLSKRNKDLVIPLPQGENKGQIFTLKNVLSLLALTVMVFLWQSGIVFKCGTFPVEIIEKDGFYYAEISKCLISTGWENTFAASNLIGESYHFPTPYHYFDMWLNGIICRLFKLNHSLSLYLIVYSFFSIVSLSGLLAIIEKFAKVKSLHKILALLLLFVSGLYISKNILHLERYSIEMEGIMERYGGKLASVYCFVLGVIILFVLNKNIKIALIILLCLPALFISLAPAVFSGMLIFCVFKMFSKKEDKKFFLRLMFYTLIVMTSIAAFYFLFKKNDLNYRLDKSLMNYSDLYSFSFFRIKFYLVELFLKCYAQPFLFILNYLPFVLLLVYLILRKNAGPYFGSLIKLFSLIWLGGLLAANTFYLMDDAYQLYANVLVFWHVLFGFSFIIFLVAEKNKSVIKYVITWLVFISLINNAWQAWHSFKKVDYNEPEISEKYLTEVNKACAEFSSEIKGATFFNERFYNNLLISYPLEYYCVPFILAPNVYAPFNLTAADEVPKSNKYQIEKTLLKSPFNQYLKGQTGTSASKDKLLCQIDFIKKYNITYLVCPKEQKTDFSNYFKIKIQIVDSLTGQRFIVLD